MGNVEMTPRDVELYRRLNPLVRLLYWLGDGFEFICVPVSAHCGPGYGMEGAAVSSETIAALDDIKAARDAFKRSHGEFLEKHPECGVGLGEYRRACKYLMDRVPHAQSDAEQTMEVLA